MLQLAQRMYVYVPELSMRAALQLFYLQQGQGIAQGVHAQPSCCLLGTHGSASPE